MPITSDNKRLYTTSSQGIAWHEVAKCLGTTRQDAGTLCGDKKIDGSSGRAYRLNPAALWKPVQHTKIGFITEADRISHFHGYVPVDFTQPKNYTILSSNYLYEDDIAVPSAWGYDVPTGIIGVDPYRIYDFLQTDSNGAKNSSGGTYYYGYYKDAAAPINMGGIASKQISLAPYTGSPAASNVVTPNFIYNSTQGNAVGTTADIQIYLENLYPKTYGIYKNINTWKTITPDSYVSGDWRLGMAVPLKVSATQYQWAFFVAETPLSSTNIATTISEMIIPVDSTFETAALKLASRRYGQTDFLCVPFLGYGLGRDNNGRWIFSGDAAKCLTFPKADTFEGTFTGFPATINITRGTVRAAYTNSTDATQNVSSLTWYTASGVAPYPVDNNKPTLFISMARPNGKPHIITDITFTVNSTFGNLSNFWGGLVDASSSNSAILLNPDYSRVTNDIISGEWDTDQQSRTFILRCVNNAAGTILDAYSGSQAYIPVQTTGTAQHPFIMKYTSDILAATQTVFDVGLLVQFT